MTLIASLDGLYDRYDITEPERRHIEALSQEVYEVTPQGVSVTLSEDGAAVLLSTIYEGSDAEWTRVLEFPFDADEWEGALQEAEDWAVEIANQAEPETYTLTQADMILIRDALAALNPDSPEAIAQTEMLELMFDTATAATVTYSSPEGN